MRGSRLIPSVLLLLALSGCTLLDKSKAGPVNTVVAALPPTKADTWLGIAGPEDSDRLRRLPMAWSEGLQEARSGRFSAGIRQEGDLLRPGAALARPAPTPGSYNCRLVRLGKTDRRSPAFVGFKPFFCYVEVEGDLLTIVKQTGSERPAGRLWEDDVATRLIFLGSVALGNENQPKAYGEDKSRDMAGVLERIGPMRWRLAIPYPRSGARLDVYELTPVAEQPKG
ncbi:hypothetical protein GCM10022280_05060 [Sphingomonas swuensis]|uniref:DUF4893 domain-containing protein n=1 Tax=Sphingomonas swuensis TaxID=977800 RepID=A0ABP7SES8_9SPHN